MSCKNVTTNKSSATILSEVYDILDDLGVPQNLSGYKYLGVGISIMVNSSPRSLSFTKELYPLIAKSCETTPSRVERAIRHAVDTIFYFRDIDILYKYFKNSVDPDKGKPSNSQFMCTITNYILRNRD